LLNIDSACSTGSNWDRSTSLTTVAKSDSQQSIGDTIDDDLAACLEADLSFEDIPIGGIIALPRHSPPNNVSKEHINEPNHRDRFSFDDASPLGLPADHPQVVNPALHVECKAWNSSDPYQTPVSNEQNLVSLTLPPPPPCHRMQIVSPHFEYPDKVYLPMFPQAA
jgi:hypothetical protein